MRNVMPNIGMKLQDILSVRIVLRRDKNVRIWLFWKWGLTRRFHWNIGFWYWHFRSVLSCWSWRDNNTFSKQNWNMHCI